MSGIMGDLGKSITGNIESAYIVVHDFRKAAARAGTEAANALLSDARKALAGNGTEGFESKDKIFRVQYNPSELELSSIAPREEERDLRPREGQANSVVQSSALPGKIELSMSLWFDKMSQGKSFMLDKALMPTSATGITGIVKAGMAEQTVRDEVEGFIAALRNPYTQWITLHWADFSFSGVLYSVHAQYTMFSVSGLPVRARVSIRVRQEASERDLDTWVKQDFDTAFEGDGSNLVLPEQRVSNLLNVGL